MEQHPENERHIRTTRSANDYQTLTSREHVYKISDSYIGSTDPESRTEILLDIQNAKLVSGDISMSRAIERLFLEILSNAGDNTDASRRAGVNPGGIDVNMDHKWIRVRNGGLTIPVETSKADPTKLVPDLIFGQLRSSSNYDTKVIRMGCGRNGFGAKLTNIFSLMFVVKIGDNINKRLYTGTWQKNMSEGPVSSVEAYNESEGFVEISWHLDFARFGLEQYPDEAFALFARYCADFSLTCKIPVSFNGIQMDFRNIRDYAALYWDAEKCGKAIIHHEWASPTKDLPNGVCPFSSTLNNAQKEKGISMALQAEHIPIIEMMILDTPDEGMCLSYVNGLLTIDGGVHVSECYNALSAQILDLVNGSMEKKGKNGKPKEKKEGDIKTPKLTSEDIKRHISIIINCRLPDPKYTSQSKTKVASPKPHVSISNKIVKSVEQWNLIARLYAALEAKMFNTLKKTNGGRAKHLDMDSGQDANDAGTEKSGQCLLYLVEGKSASSYPKLRISKTEGNKNFGGYYPLRGKFLNVKNAPILKVAANKEVEAIKTMLGLREGVDYSLQENLITLRYGYVIICVDADSDGFHIASLLINYFNQFYPGLLMMGRVAILRTPVVRLYDGKGDKAKIVGRFYNNSEFEDWLKTDAGKANKYRIVYYKGLAKSDESEVVDDLTTAPVVTVIYDDKAFESLDIAFNKDLAYKRKEWISKWREISHVVDVNFEGTGVYRKQKITGFINHELIDYTKDVLFRAIPSQDDGLKRSQRQALYAALKYFK